MAKSDDFVLARSGEPARFSAATPDPIFRIQPILGPIFGFKRVWLALRIQKRALLGRVDLKKGF